MSYAPEQPRTLILVTGADARGFLQNLITQDMAKADAGLAYAALLTPQGKYLADFFLSPVADGYRLDIATSHAAGLMQRLSMYKLRADVTLAEDSLHVVTGLGAPPKDGWPDPRHPALGWRAYGAQGGAQSGPWTALRIDHTIPEAGMELGPDSYILEHGFERLNGVDFKKGCYVGQEVTARMKHKTELKKGLRQVRIEGDAVPGTPITSGGKAVGVLHTVGGERGLAYLRFDRIGDVMEAGAAQITVRT